MDQSPIASFILSNFSILKLIKACSFLLEVALNLTDRMLLCRSSVDFYARISTGNFFCRKHMLHFRFWRMLIAGLNRMLQGCASCQFILSCMWGICITAESHW